MLFQPRKACLWVHRYTGLVMAVFLIIAGSTGSLLAFYDELDAVFNQRLAYIDVQQSTQKRAQLPIASLHDNVINAYPKYNFSSMPTSVKPKRSAVFTVDKARDNDKGISPQAKAPFQEVYVNPYNGTIIGTRDREEWAWHNVMYKVFWLHREWLLGDIGKLILGIIALIWTINCFIGFYLTLPKNAKSNKAKIKVDYPQPISRQRSSWFKRWRPAWKIRTKTNTFKLNYDMHQAFGLWLWVILFVIAWSSVGFNLKEVYQPVMHAVIGLETKDNKSKKPEAVSDTQLELQNKDLIVTKANSIDYLSQQANYAAQDNGLKVKQLLGIRWIKEDNQWQMRFLTDKDIGKKGGASSITINASSGDVEKINFGHQSPVASKVDQWMATLHMGHIAEGENQQLGHLLYQLFLVLIGLAVSVLSGTGVYLWYKGRQQRLKSMRKAPNKKLKLQSRLQ